MQVSGHEPVVLSISPETDTVVSPDTSSNDSKENSRAASLLNAFKVGSAVVTLWAIVSTVLLVWKWNDAGTIGACPGSTGVVDNNLGIAQAQIRREKTRQALAAFVDTVDDSLKAHVYYPDAQLQESQWLICTIVQQCGLNTEPGEPLYGLAIGNLSTHSKDNVFKTLSVALGESSYDHLVLQEVANLLLQEYQVWASSCPGKCMQVDKPEMLAKDVEGATVIPGVSFEYCGQINANNTEITTTWVCNERPVYLYGNMNMTTAEYYLNNVFIENTIHQRSNFYDFFSVYGDLEGDGQFGFRYSGHHFDINLMWHDNGDVTDTPAFFGHNPIHVLNNVPTVLPEDEEDKEESSISPVLPDTELWRYFAGASLFHYPSVLRKLFAVANILPQSAFVPLSSFDSTPQVGALTYRDGKTIGELPHLDLSGVSAEDFAIYMDLVEYTHLARKGLGVFNTGKYYNAFRKTGRLVWTSITSTSLPTEPADLVEGPFFFVRIESDDWLYNAMMNQMFTVVTPYAPSNHLHSFLSPMSYVEKVVASLGHSHSHADVHSHGHTHR
jgi:hypothetical protein